MTADFAQIEWDQAVIDDCRCLVRLAIREDLDQFYDWTTVSLVDDDAVGTASIIVRKSGIVAGLPSIPVVIEGMQTGLRCELLVQDGRPAMRGETIARLTGPARDILTSERLILNFLGRLSGIASLTRQYVDRVRDSQAQIYDTRKTIPGWRRLDKYAVRCGGGHNHRTGLFDAILIKDNHLAIGRQTSLTPGDAVTRARQFLARLPETMPGFSYGQIPIEVEVDSLDQLVNVLAEGPDIVLLDNMSPEQLREAVERRNQLAPAVQLEASGGVNLDTIGIIAATGVERISVGALTHSAVALDLSLEWK